LYFLQNGPAFRFAAEGRMHRKKMKNGKTQKGSALIYILIAIALLAALTASLMDSSSQQTSSQNTFNIVTELNGQVSFIRSAVQECVLNYSAGETGLIGTSNFPYPINPSSAYFTAPASPAANDNVANIRCPGNPGNTKEHEPIFGGTSGKFLPPKPNLFNDWVYYNGNDGVFFYTGTDKTDAFLSSALAKLDDQYSECEADVIDNSAGGSAMNITSAGASGPKCPANTKCFRVWMIAKTSSIYPGDADTDETTCP
jgi:hypothetical protein